LDKQGKMRMSEGKGELNQMNCIFIFTLKPDETDKF
jgi:hypothetical protein